MSQFVDPKFLASAYETEDALGIRTEAHRRYSLSSQPIFEELTQAAMVYRAPMRVLDVGAGTGSWYPWIRRYAGATTHYDALDQSSGMVAGLEKLLADDPNASVWQGDASALPFADAVFDWIGLHYMLYHVADIRAALMSAWVHLRPGGLLVAATHGAGSYGEMWALHEAAVANLSLPYVPDVRGGRFSLDNGAEFFPESPERVLHPGGLRFPSLEAFLAYYGSGFCWAGLPLNHHQPAVREALLTEVRDLALNQFSSQGYLQLSQVTGYFLLQKV
jgi:ubiquinone/menaquinone biosynthesis C-methylase UbiE